MCWADLGGALTAGRDCSDLSHHLVSFAITLGRYSCYKLSFESASNITHSQEHEVLQYHTWPLCCAIGDAFWHVRLNRCDVMWCDVMWCDVMWCDVMWCDVMWCDVMWCDVMWCDVMWCDFSLPGIQERCWEKRWEDVASWSDLSRLGLRYHWKFVRIRRTTHR